MSEKTRWRVAHWLDKLPGFCWADLVTWALGWHGIRQTRVSAACDADLARNGVCYCGKRRFPQNGES
jgi:hypothetical protein